MTRVKAPEFMQEPIAKPTPGQSEMIEAIAEAWRNLPEWEMSRLISSAADISQGTYQSTPRGVSDEDLLSGLRALTPDPGEED